jgi:hypothetical protein
VGAGSNFVPSFFVSFSGVPLFGVPFSGILKLLLLLLLC